MKKQRRSKKSSKTKKFKKESDLPPMAVSFADTRYNKTGDWRAIKPVIDYTKCTSCMICWKFCPDACVKIINGMPHIDFDYCKGCAICIEECPVKAIKAEEEKK
jgi:2-oxoacid:acceptor oxidoreductase delta subunit (pyruvate/2-ketoisovalerate family)